jgi:hypothetical protein
MGGSAAGARNPLTALLDRKHATPAATFQILPERCMNGGFYPVQNSEILALTLNPRKRFLLTHR